jgi:Tfp pilus assembly protein PilV
MLMGVGIVGAASLFSLSSRASAAAEHRTQASHVIVSEMETIQALPYSKVGLNPAAKGFQRAYEGRETAVWTKPSAATPDPVSPYSVRVINGTSYTIVRNITWADSGTGAYLVKKSYKVLNIEVQWVDSSGTHTIQQESGVYQEGGTETSQAGGK